MVLIIPVQVYCFGVVNDGGGGGGCKDGGGGWGGQGSGLFPRQGMVIWAATGGGDRDDNRGRWLKRDIDRDAEWLCHIISREGWRIICHLPLLPGEYCISIIGVGTCRS